MTDKTRVLILGGGFGGLYAALEFEKRKDPRFEVTLISRENFFLFTPMLHEIAASDLDLTNIVNPVRKMNPALNLVACPKERGRIKVNTNLEVEGIDGLWALGDCALVPDRTTGGYCPPTAQHASREGKIVAQNTVASVYGEPKKPFSFKTLGLLAAIGRRTGVARILGVNFSGFLAWFLWRGIYWSKLPRMEKKVRVAIDWALDVFFSKDFVQYLDQRALAHTQTETRTAPWNREQLSVPDKVDNRIAA